ncbi:hypothetical protein DFH09DRAFT_1367251 [Mycena vulgaris]|nr:hypothetical protein DFH09DRAFT_1367251 [Mycena vulgaris]
MTRLVESRKSESSDMEGMLIFAGLFSASLAAFIPLTQISRQLAAAANGSTFTAPAPTVFIPLATSLVCNALWFISLGLSLTCALIATLLEQWASDFLHRADMRSAPDTRARIFSYLYYGLKRFNMHTVVDIIPLLLHASLLLFFAGLVAFLIPIHLSIAAVAAAILVIVAAIASLQLPPNSPRYLEPPNFQLYYGWSSEAADAIHYTTSISALVDWNIYCGVARCLAELTTYLAICEAHVKNRHDSNL